MSAGYGKSRRSYGVPAVYDCTVNELNQMVLFQVAVIGVNTNGYMEIIGISEALQRNKEYWLES
jgi:hypothetical protein